MSFTLMYGNNLKVWIWEPFLTAVWILHTTFSKYISMWSIEQQWLYEDGSFFQFIIVVAVAMSKASFALYNIN